MAYLSRILCSLHSGDALCFASPINQLFLICPGPDCEVLTLSQILPLLLSSKVIFIVRKGSRLLLLTQSPLLCLGSGYQVAPCRSSLLRATRGNGQEQVETKDSQSRERRAADWTSIAFWAACPPPSECLFRSSVLACPCALCFMVPSTPLC